ncbi:LAME_0C05952g1_1 [Lachancea meyersii CBS 8951]|uniref:LAME_0C05952g1_1 n=1 Tax=Lachancea meyersii CBS 8951 TaxID=1266667 RepID=A0A1G4J2N9_9SACH|nr:LAME_0C05952g1_1 [Lachancea meyersii CBS 8951]
MEFFYEEQAAANGPGASDSQLEHDKSTEEAFERFEGSIDKQYQKTAEAVKKLIKNDERTLELNIPLDPHLSERAQEALDSLDHQLHNVENLAQNYWQKVASTSFWSNVSDSLGLNGQNETKNSNQVNLQSPVSSQGKAVTPVAGNRTEAELRLLSSDQSIYLNSTMNAKGEGDGAKAEAFDVDAHTTEIADLLKADSVLTQTMNALVPEHVSYGDFWDIYFTRRQKILDMENQRKDLLKKEAKDSAPVDWDDEDEDEDDGTKDNGKDNKNDGEKKISPDENVKKSSHQETIEGSDEDDDDWE